MVYRELPKNAIVLCPIYLAKDPSAREYHVYYVKDVIVTGKGCTLFHLHLLCSAPNRVAKYKKIIAISGSQLLPPGLDAASCWINDAMYHLGSEAMESVRSKMDLIMHGMKKQECAVIGKSYNINHLGKISSQFDI